MHTIPNHSRPRIENLDANIEKYTKATYLMNTVIERPVCASQCFERQCGRLSFVLHFEISNIAVVHPIQLLTTSAVQTTFLARIVHSAASAVINCVPETEYSRGMNTRESK